MTSENPQGAVADTLKLFVATLVLLVVLASSLEDQTKYAWAQHELELFRDLRLSSWQAYVDAFVSAHYWSPLNDGQDVSIDVLRPGRNMKALGPVEQDEFDQRDKSIQQISAVLRKHNVDPRREPLRAGAMFGWTGNAPNLTGALRDYRIGNAGYLWLFKPAVDDLTGWIDRALGSAGNMEGALVSLKCAPPSSDQIDLVKSYDIGVLQDNGDSGQIATYMDATLGRESPAITSRCVLTVNYAGRAQLGVYSEDLKGHVTALYGPDPRAWLKFTAANHFKSIPETMPDFRLHRLEEGYEDPFIGGHNVFLPYAHAVWPEISNLSIDDAINYLSLKRVQKREDVEIFGFKIPFEVVVASSPILIVMLCINLHYSLGRATSEQLRTQLPLLRKGDRFPKVQYLLCLSLAIGLPAYALLYITYLLLTQATETDSLSTLLSALKETVGELDLPPYWEPIRKQAEGVLDTTLWTLFLAIAALTTIVVIGWWNAQRSRVLWTGSQTPLIAGLPPGDDKPANS